MARGTGATTRQMLGAPKSAIYIWCNRHLEYPKELARQIGREDLKVVSPNWLEPHNFVGLRFTAAVLDHALKIYRLNESQYDSLKYLQTLTRIIG